MLVACCKPIMRLYGPHSSGPRHITDRWGSTRRSVVSKYALGVSPSARIPVFGQSDFKKIFFICEFLYSIL